MVAWALLRGSSALGPSIAYLLVVDLLASALLAWRFRRLLRRVRHRPARPRSRLWLPAVLLLAAVAGYWIVDAMIVEPYGLPSGTPMAGAGMATTYPLVPVDPTRWVALAELAEGRADFTLPPPGPGPETIEVRVIADDGRVQVWYLQRQ
jgi:hypothetical protein